ncbi:MAG: fumarate hydratase [Nitrospirae bacterium]|nr:fumarate hydratase [Nitrospirota bacterium]
MLKLRDGIVELYKKVSTSIPPDVEGALKSALPNEEDPGARDSLSEILGAIQRSRQGIRPACIDTGIPIFRVKVPRGLSHTEIRNTIRESTAIATRKVPLGPSAVDILTGENSGDNTGIGFPLVYLDEAPDDTLTVDLMLRGGDCENYGRIYSLPDETLDAGRDFSGVEKCVLDCVTKARGKGCPPYTVGIGIGATQAQVPALGVLQLFRRISDENEYQVLGELERTLLAKINELGTGPMGRGGKTTAVGVKIGITHRHPESYLVSVSLACWANRRGRLVW